jgi:hypothetical protein
MSLLTALALAVCFVAFALWVRFGRRVWRNEWKWAWNPDEVPVWWDHGGPLWRGFVRVSPVCGGLIGLLAAAAVLLSFDDPLIYAIGQFVGALAVGGLGLPACIVLFNRPKTLVAPHLRHQPGALAEWGGAEVLPTEPPRPPGDASNAPGPPARRRARRRS